MIFSNAKIFIVFFFLKNDPNFIAQNVNFQVFKLSLKSCKIKLLLKRTLYYK